MTLSAGTRLGPYEVLGLIGAGGMGEVCRARDTRLDRIVALKVIAGELTSDHDRLLRFERVHDVGVHEGAPYIVTELLEGATLRQVTASRTPTTRQVLTWAVQAAQGLAAAHARGIDAGGSGTTTCSWNSPKRTSRGEAMRE